jgi:pimeloyl-ACP methyl ester carboxylesterase
MRAVMTLVDGRILVYANLGPPADPVAMYFHGAPMSGLDLRWCVGQLASAGIRVVAADRPGCGRSSPPGQGHVSLLREIPQLCADLLTLSKGPAR